MISTLRDGDSFTPVNTIDFSCPSANAFVVPGSSKASLYLAALTLTRNRPCGGNSLSEILKLDMGPYVLDWPNISRLGIAGLNNSPSGTRSYGFPFG